MENHTVENDFFNWLSTRVSPAQLSELYTLFSGVNEFCLSRKILKTHLFQTTDIATLAKVRHTVESDKVFAFQHKKHKKQMLTGVQYYIKYIKEVQPKPQTEPEVKETPKARNDQPKQSAKCESLLDLLVRNNIPYIDNRDKQGSLWIIGEDELKPFVEKCKSLGIEFHYKDHSRTAGGKPAWWTNDELKAASGLDVVKENRSAFISWLMNRGIDNSSVMKYLLYLKKCGEHAASIDCLGKNIYAVTLPEEIDEIQDSLVSDKKFLMVNKSCSNHLIEAMALFSRYLHEKEEVTPAPEDNETSSAVSGNSTEDCGLVSDVLTGEKFVPLLSALQRHGVKTIAELKDIKLWQFMNRYDLYSIATRQNIFDSVQAILSPKMSTDEAQQYKLTVNDTVFNGCTPAEAYLSFCEYLARKYPLRIRGLIGKKTSANGQIALFKADDSGCFLKLVNPTAYISNTLTADTVIQNATFLFSMCANVNPAISIEAPSSPNCNFIPPTDDDDAEPAGTNEGGDTTGKPEGTQSQPDQPILTPYDKKMIAQAEKVVFDADLDGISYDDLRDELDITAVGTKKYVSISEAIVEIKNKLYHKDAIIDWDDGAECLDGILEKLMQKNNGYVSSAQLYDYARVEMNMFLNDNDFNDERSVFEIAQHLFSKSHYHDKQYSFIGKMHISKATDTITNNFDIFCKYASDQGGIFVYTDLIDYLASIGLKAGNLRAQLKLYTDPEFFYIEEGVLISAKSMLIDDTWNSAVKNAIAKLFDDVGDHIILREIQPFWFDQLPSLPSGRRWTPLLLQSVLRFYSDKLGARTIFAMESQGIDTLHSMLVRNDSPIQNFGDAVISYLLENGIESRCFEAEALRTMLVNARMIHGNELLNNMSKALGGDERFAWDVGGNNVTIRV